MPDNLTDYEENRLLDLSLLNTDKLALMAVLGSDAAAGTEVTGGSYARQTLTFAAASAGSKANSAALTYASMPATEVQGWAVYDTAGTGRKWWGVWLRTSATATASTDRITATAHGRSDGDKIVFQTGYVPAGLTANTTYFVRDKTTNDFKVSATLGGTAIDLTADNASVVFGLVYDVTAGGTFSVASGTGLVCSLT